MQRLSWLAPAVLLLAACAQSGATAAPGNGGFSVSGAAPARVDAVTGKALPVPPQPATGEGSAANGLPIPQAFDADRNLILTASMSLRAGDPWAIADKAQAIAAGLGGDVMGLTESGTKNDRIANLVLRVPSDRFTDALRQLRGLDAEVVSSSVDGKDVTDQFVDLKARLSAKQSEEQRYLALLARADKIDDILKIDQSISLVRTQIEQLQGQVNSISARTRFSTITVSVSTAAASIVPDPKAGWDPSRTAALALATLATLLRGLADLAIWLLVFGWIPLLLLAGALIVSRRIWPASATS
ncbi:MAG TPA: DUF4349 domain-containing protein [Candidatus Limnocylindria bacterium]|nr:DUF4349 domain-containing protein [Candidatus Limnocylindria bacterium]